MTDRPHIYRWFLLVLLVVSACSADPITGTPATTIPSAATTAPTTSTATTLLANLTVVEVLVREGRVVTEDRVDVPLGNRILMQFDTDTALLVHIHGYDHEFRVKVGNSATYEFEGNIAGIFEVEDHVTHRLLLELIVSP